MLKKTAPPDLPVYLLIEFDNYSGPYIINNWFPIIPISKSWMNKGIKFTRKQFPLILGHAFTIHKSQGLTISKVTIVDIFKKLDILILI